MIPAIERLISEYKKRRFEIKKRLEDFAPLHKGKDKDIFSELCFCILTPQAKATSCDGAIKKLKEKNLLFKGCVSAVRKYLKGAVRFHNKKAEYLIEARNRFKTDKGLDLKSKIDMRDPFMAREWLVANIKGLGYKEASHFLRNIGLGKDLAILDVHILKNMKRYGIVKDIPSSITKKTYLDFEEKMRSFSRKTKIPLGELDLLFWSIETGFIFK